MKLKYAIQAHPKRRPYVRELLRQLGRDTPVAWDEKRSVWDTWKRAALLCNGDSDFTVVIQDDAVLGKDFHRRLEKVVDREEEFAYCLFYRLKNKKTHKAFNAAGWAGRKRGGFAFPRFQFCVGSAIPTRWIPDIIEYGDSLDADGLPSRGDDPRINAFLNSRGILTFYPLPSLVSHRIGRSISHPNRPERRVSSWFA